MNKPYDPQPRRPRSALVTNLVVAVGTAAITFTSTRLHETYKTRTAWSIEIARQQMQSAHELLKAAYRLRESSIGSGAARGNRSSDVPVGDNALPTRVSASHDLLAAYKYSRTLFPDETIEGFRSFNDQALAVPSGPSPLSKNDQWSMDATLDNASAAITRFVVESNMTATDRNVQGFFAALLTRAETCPDGSVTTGEVLSLAIDHARVSGRSTFAGSQAWFDFDASPRLAYSLGAQNGVGLATTLKPSTTYYYRYVTASASAVCRGAIRTFTTRPQ